MSVLPMGDILTIASHEYDKPCGGPNCPASATWAIWVSHNLDCVPADGFRCEGHKESIEAHWAENVNERIPCECGHVAEGQLSDHFRAIKL